MRKHFVIFFSPGTFVAETTQKPIESWDIDKAVKMSREITERYNAKPYGFCFVTRERKPRDLDSEEVERSTMYYLGGEVITLDELKAQNNSEYRILIENMECNGWNRVVVNKNSRKWTQPLNDGDTVLDYQPQAV